MDLMGQFRAADSLFRLVTGDMQRVTSYPFQPYERKKRKDSSPLPVSLPEEQGVPSSLVEEFLKRLDEDETLCPHSVAVLRHGRCIVQGSWAPYSARTPQMQFSLSKSVVGMAVGMAVEEGLLTLDDKMKDIFPDKLPPLYLGKPGEVTVRQLLTMSSGVRFNELGTVSEKDWVRAWLLSDCDFEPGSRFSYNSMNTYLLAAAVCRKSGQTLTEYLTPRLWQPLGISVPRWETCPMGIEKGGWGLYLTPGDMARLGQLLLQKGVWQQEGGLLQVLPESWVEAATQKQIDCKMGERDAWYGYQLWGLAWGTGYQFNGVFGQYVAVLPEQDMVVAVTSGNEQLFEDRTLLHVRECFCREGVLSETPLTLNAGDTRSLRETMERLHVIPELRPEPEEPVSFFQRLFGKKKKSEPVFAGAEELSGREYVFEKNSACLLPMIVQGVHGNFPGTISRIRMRMGEDRVRFWVGEGESIHTFEAGTGGVMLPGMLVVQGEGYPIRAGVRLTRDEDDRTVLKLFLVFCETPCVRTVKMVFHGKDREKLLLRLDECPSVARAVEMFASLVTGGKAPGELVPENVQKLPVFDRMKELLRPKASGSWKP